MKKYLLIEDECTPDAFTYFCKELKKITNYSFQDFRTKGKEITDDFSTSHIYKGYIIKITFDFQYWTLDKLS